MRKRKFFDFVTVLVLAVAMVATCAACGGCGRKNETIIAELPQEIELFGQFELTFLEGIEPSEVVVESSDTDVIDVSEKGVLAANAVGEATVTLTCGNRQQSKVIKTVFDAERIVINEHDFGILKNSSVSLVNPVTYNGKAVGGVVITAVSSDSGIVAAENNVLTGIEIGEADVIVTATINGTKAAEKTVRIKVNANVGIYAARHAYELYALDEVRGMTFEKSAELGGMVYVDGREAEDARIAWTIEDESVAVIDSGIITALAVGETKVVGKWIDGDGKEYYAEIPVSVKEIRLDVGDEVLVDLGKRQTALDGAELFGGERTASKVISVSDGKEYALNGGLLENSVFEKSGEYAFEVYCAEDAIVCRTGFIVADFVIYDKNDLAELSAHTDGYIALGNNLENVGNYNNNYASNTFSGVFNGMGYNIDGMTINSDSTGLFGFVTGATFKNVSFTNLVPRTWNSGALFYRSRGAVTIDNVYVHTSSFGTGARWAGGLFAFLFDGSVTMTNCILEIEGLDSNATVQEYCGAICGRCGGTLDIFDSYVVAQGNLCGIGTHDNNTKYESVNARAILYADAVSFVQAKSAGEVSLSGFNRYWDLTGDVPRFFTAP